MENQGYPPPPPYYYQDDEISATDIIRNLKKWFKEIISKRRFILKWASIIALCYVLFWIVTSAFESVSYIDRKYFTIEKTRISQLGQLTIQNEHYNINRNLTEYQDIIKSMLIRPPKVTNESNEPIANQIIETYQLEEKDEIVKIENHDLELSPNENKSLRNLIQRVIGLNIKNEFDQRDIGLIKIVEDTLVFNEFKGVSKIESNTIDPVLSTSLKEEIYQELQTSYMSYRDEKLRTELQMKTLLLDTLIAERNIAAITFYDLAEKVQRERDLKSSGIISNATPVSPDAFVSKDLITEYNLAEAEYIELEKRSIQLEESIEIQKFAVDNEIIEFRELSNLEKPLRIQPLSFSEALKQGIHHKVLLWFILSSMFLGMYVLLAKAFREVNLEE